MKKVILKDHGIQLEIDAKEVRADKVDEDLILSISTEETLDNPESETKAIIKRTSYITIKKHNHE